MKKIIYSVAFIAIVAGLIMWSKSMQKSRQVTLSNREVALTCTTDMATEFHIHPELTIIIDGVEVMVPENTGIVANCMNPLHTHNEPHIIHVESPIKRDFSLGDFFAVWKEEFTSTRLLDKVASSSDQIVVTVNGQKVDTYEDTILRDLDKIVITYTSKQ